MSSRFSRADSAEIWNHLNALDDDLTALEGIQNGLVDNAIEKIVQTLTEAEQLIVRTNIGAALRPRLWKGKPAADVTLAASNYKSILPSTVTEATGGTGTPLLGLTWAGDTFKPNVAGWYDLTWCARFPVNSTGNREASIRKNPGVTTYSSTVAPSTGTDLNTANGRSPDTVPVLTCVWSGWLATTDVIMLIARSTDATTLTAATSLLTVKLTGTVA